MKTRFFFNGARDVSQLTEIPKMSSFFGIDQQGPDLCSAISPSIAGGTYGLLPGLYPIVGPAGAGKTTYLFGHNDDNDAGLFGQMDDLIDKAQVSGRINLHVWQIGEPEYVPAGDAETSIKAFIADLLQTNDSMFFVDSLRDLTVLAVSGLSALNQFLAETDGTAIANNHDLRDTIDRMQAAAQSIPDGVKFSPSNAIGKGGLPSSYVSILSFINALCEARDNVCFAVLNPLFITEESYITTIDAVTQGAIRIGSDSSSLLRLYEYQARSIKRVQVRCPRNRTTGTYEVGSVVHQYDESERPAIPDGVLGAYYSGVYGFPTTGTEDGANESGEQGGSDEPQE